MIFGNKKWQNGSFSTVYPCFDRGMGIPIARWGRMVSLSAPGAKESDIWTPQNFVVWHSWWVSNRLAPRDFNSNLPRNFDRNWFFVIRYSVEPSQFFKFWFFLQTIFLFFFLNTQNSNAIFAFYCDILEISMQNLHIKSNRIVWTIFVKGWL